VSKHPVRVLREYLAELFVGGVVGDIAAFDRRCGLEIGEDESGASVLLRS